MNYLTAQQDLFIHARLVSEIGGSHGLRDLGLLESAVARHILKMYDIMYI